MSILAEFDLSDLPDDPRVPDGDYIVEVIDAEMESGDVITEGEHAGKTPRWLVFDYEILQGDYREFDVPSKPQPCNPWDDLELKAALGLQLSARVRRGQVVSVRSLR